jgi:hypothetical protein
LAAGAQFCARCGARLEEPAAQELRGVLYLLSELAGWEAQALIGAEEAVALRRRYEMRREELRAQLAANGEQPLARPSSTVASSLEAFTQQSTARPVDEAETAAVVASHARARPALDASALSTNAEARAARQSTSTRARRARRPFFETLADPHTLPLLLYTGAAMLVVAVVLWLRDALYLKLQEPLAQAELLALGTLLVTVCGWLTTLRTRLRLTGRALTLIGSLLVPVNFWFLVRSGLITNNGRAWMVCALCAALYAFTAFLLRASLYVYLSSAASVATVWALVFRATPEAYGLYALALMTASLISLHLSRLFPLSTGQKSQAELTNDAVAAGSTETHEGSSETNKASQASRLSYEVWGTPLVRVALCGATAASLFYMLLRLGPSPALDAGTFRWHASNYQARIAMLLFVACAHLAWFTARFIYTDRRRTLYTLATLALFWTEFLLLDGLRAGSQTRLLALGLASLLVSLAARLMTEETKETLARALHRAAAIVAVTLVLATPLAQLTTASQTLGQSAALAVLGIALASLSAPRLTTRFFQLACAHAAAVFLSLAFLVALTSGSLADETTFAICAAWPFALYACARLMTTKLGERQLSAPFLRIADLEFTLLFLSSSVIALILYLSTEKPPSSWRPAIFFVFAATILYGALRGWRERSTYGAGLASLAALVSVAAALDALGGVGLFPQSWPIAGGVIITAFLLQAASRRWLRPNEQATFGRSASAALNEQSKTAALDKASKAASLSGAGSALTGAGSLDATIRLMTDGVCFVCAMLWLMWTLARMSGQGWSDGFDARSTALDGWSAASVLLLASLYWMRRAADERAALFVYLASGHAGAFLLALLTALSVERRWMAAVFTLTLFPLLFALGHAARARGVEWLATHASRAAAILLAMISLALAFETAPVLQTGNGLLLAPAVTAFALCAAFSAASFFSAGRERVRYFRAALAAALAAFVLMVMRAGFDPLVDVEMYTSPIAVLLLVVSYLSIRREWNEYARDTILLLWTGALLLCGPLLIRALQFRLLLDLPAPARDLATLGVSLALLLLGVFARLRAPVVVGIITLVLELVALTLTSVHWLQVPIWIYLTTAGVIIMTVWGMFEYQRERVIQMRQRLHERGAQARASFSEWR